MACYTDNKLTWQAHSIMQVMKLMLEKGYFPNGTKMKAKDKQDAIEGIENCKAVLNHFGITIDEPKPQGQLALF